MRKLLDTLVMRPNRWYDRLQEPWRFVFFISIFAVVLIASSIFNLYPIFLISCGIVCIWRLTYFSKRVINTK